MNFLKLRGENVEGVCVHPKLSCAIILFDNKSLNYKPECKSVIKDIACLESQDWKLTRHPRYPDWKAPSLSLPLELAYIFCGSLLLSSPFFVLLSLHQAGRLPSLLHLQHAHANLISQTQWVLSCRHSSAFAEPSPSMCFA